MDRPFEPTGMTTQKWMQLPVDNVRLDELVLCQDQVSIDGIRNSLQGESYSGDPVPHVVVYRGKKYLSDGHHRYVISLVKGEEQMEARIFVKH